MPALVVGIQCAQVLGRKRLFHAMDIAWLDYRHKAGNEGNVGFDGKLKP
jgi:hypothetical protein